jgi:hypothetical protein
METTTVPHVVEVLAGAFQGRGLAGTDGPPRFVGGEVARRLGATASEASLSDMHVYQGRMHHAVAVGESIDGKITHACGSCLDVAGCSGRTERR